jgi:glycosyltransferase involved in cell wall biosynthesis
MHILEIPSFFPPYGGLFCLDQAKALKALGHEVRILSNVQLGATIGLRDYVVRPYLRYEHVMDGITVCQSYQRGLPGVIRFNVNRWVNIVCSMFDDYVKKYGKPDVLHAHCAKWAGYAAMKISEKYGIPYVISEHLSKLLFEKEFGPAPSDAWQIPMLKACYHEAKMVMPVAEELVDNIACYFGKDYRWMAISNTIDTQYFCYRPRAPREGRTFRFCCLANFWPLKGYDVLIPAFQQLRQSGEDAELHIAGRDTDTKAFRAQLSSGMKVHGLLDKAGVRQLLYECDALVLASRSEVQPLVLLEAMSTGIPVIATDCIPQCLRIEGGCSIVPVDDAAALSQAMAQVMTGPEVDGEKLSEQVKALASPQVVGMCLQTIFGEAIVSH